MNGVPTQTPTAPNGDTRPPAKAVSSKPPTLSLRCESCKSSVVLGVIAAPPKDKSSASKKAQSPGDLQDQSGVEAITASDTDGDDSDGIDDSSSGANDEGNGSGASETPRPSVPRTRVGRFIKAPDEKNPHLKIQKVIDEADWDGQGEQLEDGKFALLIRHRTRWTRTSEEVFQQLVFISPTLISGFRSVVTFFPGIRLEGNRLIIEEPFASLFFYWERLQKRGEEETDADALADWGALNYFYPKWIQPNHDRIKRLQKEGAIMYEDLWALFQPGDIVYSLDESDEPCLFVMVATEYRQPESWGTDKFTNRKVRRLAAEMWAVVWDGATNKFQRRARTRSIRIFSGTRSITSLPFYPLSYYRGGSTEEAGALRQQLEERGRKWRMLVSSKPICKYYDGPGQKTLGLGAEHLQERVVVDGSASSLSYGPVSDPRDAALALSQSAGDGRRIEYEDTIVGTGWETEHEAFDNCPKEQEFTPFQAQLCPSSLVCYGLVTGAWFDIRVSAISDVEWQDHAIDHLVLDPRAKKKLVSLVAPHQKNQEKGLMGDVISSKGKGLVVVLHGPPGVGKTLTAETVAEHTKKPLYPLNVGELTGSSGVVTRLQTHFARAAHWDAVLLLDEADVLLESRSYENLHRNGVVSVFLRMLEYYEGILFLTTNRIICMDPAFQSRIQLALKYPSLNSATRSQIWKTFIDRLDPEERQAKQDLLERLDDVSEWDLNGRQIRNIISTAEALALSEGKRRGALRYHHVQEVANDTMDFQEFFKERNQERKGQLGDVHPRQFRELKAHGFGSR